MACIFCGRKGRSREHVIPRWLDGPLRASQRAVPGSPLTNRYTPPPGSDIDLREWSSDRPELVTTSLCAACNNGWLNATETGVRPFLEPMIVGRPVRLDSAAQKTVALWAYKTALLMQLVRPAEVRVVPRERYADLHADRRPPTDVRIWIAATQGGSAVHEASTTSILTSANATTPAYVAVIALGNLLLISAGRIEHSDTPLRFSAASEGPTLLPVWPASVRTVGWPPPRVVENLDLSDLGAIERLF